jgi:hypothetical protein
MTDQATIPTPAGGAPVAPQQAAPATPTPPQAPTPGTAPPSVTTGTLDGTVSGAADILAKLASPGIKRSSFVALMAALVQTLLGGVLVKNNVTPETLQTWLSLAFDGGTAVYIVVRGWHDVQAGKIAAVVTQAAQAVEGQQGV